VKGRDVEILVLDDEEAAAAACADRLVEGARAGLEIALTGGSTPRRAYELAAQREQDWSRAGAWWGDERCVPPDDDRSNYGMAREALLDRVSQPRVHRIRGELDPAEAAAEYARELGDTRLDLVLLGLGPDGHVASLFPGAPTLEERKRRVVAAEAGHEPFVPRVTLTLPLLCAGHSVLFLVTGEAKAEAARAAFTDEPSTRTPGSLVRARDGDTVAILDRAAASALSKS
jgi:6-phosphogluconolactonase